MIIDLNCYRKDIPIRNYDPSSFPLHDQRHWYDMEYAGWDTRKINLPDSPYDGCENKCIICIIPGDHSYFDNYLKAMTGLSESYKLKLTIYNSKWSIECQRDLVDNAINSRPDLIILLPVASGKSTSLFKKINKSGIPVIAGNFMPDTDSFRYFLAWSGPDDWWQSRLLARKFAELMDYKGGYSIFQHLPGTSSYFARTYGVITELNIIAPDMVFLEAESSLLDEGISYDIMKRWIGKYGERLNGIFSSDDHKTMLGAFKAISDFAEHDIVCVATGCTPVGMELLKNGKLRAMTYQSPEMDATTSMQMAIDWFNGLYIPPIKHLPSYVIIKDDIDNYNNSILTNENIDLEILCNNIYACDIKGVISFYDNLYEILIHAKTMTAEYLNGLLLRLLLNILRIIREKNFNESEIFKGYDYLFKYLYMQRTTKNSIEWIKSITIKIIDKLLDLQGTSQSLSKELVTYVNENYTKPLSLKVLSHHYNVSAGYLGQMFKKETGKSFTDYVNELRVNNAKKLLTTTTFHAKEISKMIGFDNPDYFYYVFKKYTGYFPSDFRINSSI